MADRLVSMRLFAAVVDAKSFSAAAARLRTSKSRVSRQVSALESALSVKLLHRSTRKLSLTEAGALFYEHCTRIVKEAELAEERMKRARSEPEGLVKVTAVPAFAIRHVVPALAEFRAVRNPSQTRRPSPARVCRVPSDRAEGRMGAPSSRSQALR